MLDLLLASSSPYRRQLLERLGIPFRWRAPLVDEEALKSASRSPRELAEHLAEAKAVSLAGEEPAATILGGDQLVACDERVLGKPGTLTGAVEQLAFLADREHALITAVCIWHAGQIHRHTDVTRLRMRRLSRAEIERYLQADQPFDCAGSYKLESRGITLFEAIESADHSAITGLPLIAVTGLLREIGFAIP